MQTKSCELNPIHTHILKRVLPTLIPLITHIVNAWLTSACFCEEWKTSVVKPLLKKKGLDPQEKNYHPVSNLPFFSKLVEHATLMQFGKHCREHHLLSDFQSAYRKGYSTKTSLMKMTNDIFWSMERKQVANIASWMDTMHLKLNPDKTEFIMFGYRNQLDKCKTSYVTISGSTIPESPSVKYLGVTLDKNLNLKEHILTKCKSAIANFVRIRNIQQYLTTDACSTLVLGLCISHLDYANTLYYGLPDKTISNLQIVQSMCAKLTLRKSKYDSTTDALLHLHWLPIKQRINFKIATITHKCIYGTTPQYLKDLLILAPNPRSLRSSNDRTKLIIPFTRCKTFAAQSFSIAAPMIWNQLPKLLHETTNLKLFKRQLKTHLYRVAFH